MGWGYWGGFSPYVSKAEKLRKAEKTKAALAKKGIALEPVLVNGREIARTWWGKTWSQNLERYADYENRVPRGRTYVRSGAVLDLKITPNTITAMVSGSRSKPYTIKIGISSLDKKVERALMEKSRSSLDSMQSLLSGEFPADLKDRFFKQGTGLFPSPKEIKLDCSCPDWADMCKHVAAALYGTAVRLDEKPELFFVLRGIKIDDFVGKMIKREQSKMLKKATVKTARMINAKDDELSELFGIEMDDKANKEENLLHKKNVKTGVSHHAKSNKITKATRKKKSGKAENAATKPKKRSIIKQPPKTRKPKQ
jgi:uncharacterized Zn finger protein